MSKNGKPATLIQLAGRYRPAAIPADQPGKRDLAGAVSIIHSNCAVTIHFTEQTLRKAEEDGEEFFAVCALRAEAILLKKRCASLARLSLSKNLRKEVETL